MSVQLSLKCFQRFIGRMLMETYYIASMIDDMVQVYIFYDTDAIGFSEMFAVRILKCEEASCVFVTQICAMFGHMDAPVDDMIIGISNVKKYKFANHIMILRELFPGFNVMFMDIDVFERISRPFLRTHHTCQDVLERKVPRDIAETIVNCTKPDWLKYNPGNEEDPDTFMDAVYTTFDSERLDKIILDKHQFYVHVNVNV